MALDRQQFERFIGRFDAGRVVADAPLAPLTTFNVGGPADWLIDIRTVTELTDLLEAAGITTVKSPADMGATMARVLGKKG